MRTTTTKSLVRTSFLLAAALALTPAIGATVTWDTSSAAGFQPGNGTWGTDSFWSSDGTTLSPWVSGDAAVFLGENTAVTNTITVGSAQNISGLSFGSATTFGDWTFAGSGMSLSANSTFTVNAGSTASIGNTISGAFSLTKAGTGSLTLTGTNTYTGATTVSAGTLVYANAFAASAHTIASGAVLELNTASDRISGTTSFSGEGTLRKTGAGTIQWASGIATFSLGTGALIDIQGGAFTGGSFGNEIWTNNLADLNVAAGAVFNGVEANVRVNRLTGAGTIKSGFGGAGYQALTFGVDNGSSNFDGVIADSLSPANIVKEGTGTIVFRGANTYTGTTTVSAGTLTLASGASLATSGFTTLAGATLVLNSSATVTTLSGSGNIQIGSGATLTLNNSTAQAIGSGVASSLASTGAFSGAGTFVKSGTGLLYVQGDFSSTTTNVTLSGGSFQFVGSSGADTNAFGTGTITVTANSTLNTYTDGTRTKSSRLLNAIAVTGGTLALGAGSVGSGSLTLAGGLTATNAANVTVGGGRVILESDLAMNGTGAFTLTGGTLQLGNNTATGSINGGLAFNATAGTLEFKRSDNVTYSGAFSGTGSLTQAGTGNLTLTGANTYTGTTTVSAGTLTLASGATMSAGALSVASGASLVLNASATTSTLTGSGAITIGTDTTFTLNTVSASPQFLGTFSGAGSLVKSGAGEVLLTGDNSGFTGAITINGGMISVQNSISTLGSGDITVTANATIGTYTGAGFTTPGRLNNKLTVTAGTLTLGRNGRTILGNDVIASGTGSIVVGGGGTTVIEKDISITGAGTLSVAAGTTLQLGNGGTTGTFNGGLSFNQTTGNLAFNRSDNINYTGVLSGTGSLTQAGTGNLTLSGANTYTGVTTVSAGTLTLASGASLTSSGFITAAGATLALNASTTVTTLSGFGNIQIGSGATLTLNNSAAQSIGSGVASSLASTGAFSGAGSFVKSGTGLLYVQGDFSSTTTNVTLSGGSFQFVGSSGADTNAFGTGTITVTANSTLNTYTDGTRTKSSRLLNAIAVTGGTLALGTGSGGSGALILAGGLTATNAANVTVGGGRVILESDLAVNGTGAFTLTGGTLQLGNNTATGSINGGLSFSATAGALDFRRSDNVTYSGAFSGTGNLTQAGTGNLTLTGVNTYTGRTTVSTGTLTLASGATMSAAALSVASGASLVLNASATTATLTGSGDITIASGATLTLNTTVGAPQFLGTLSGAGSLVKSASGNEVLFAGNNSGFLGAITINGGMISVQNSISTLGSGDITVTANATVGTYTGPAYTIPGRLNNKLTVTAGTLTLGRNGRTILGNDVIASGTGSIVVGGGGTTVIEKDISITGAGTLSVAAGTTLQLGNGGTTGTFNGGLSFNQTTGNLAFNRSDSVSYMGVLSGTGSLTQAGAGNLILSGLSTYTGTTTVSAGTLTVGSGGALGTGIVTVSGTGLVDLGGQVVSNSFVVNGGTLQGGPINMAKITATAGVINSDLNGSTGFTKTGTGTLILGGTNSYAGGTSVNGGTLLVHGTTGAVTVASGGTLGGNGSVGNTSVASGGTIAAGASVGLLNVGNLTLAGGSAMAWQLNDASKMAGVGYDLIVASNLDLSGLSSVNRATLNLMTLANPAASVSGTPVVFDKAFTQSFTLLNYSTLNLGANSNVSNLFTINLNGFVAQDGSALNVGDFAVINDAGSNSLMLAYYSPVPEPSTYGLCLGFLSLAVVAIRRQRRKPSAQA